MINKNGDLYNVTIYPLEDNTVEIQFEGYEEKLIRRKFEVKKWYS